MFQHKKTATKTKRERHRKQQHKTQTNTNHNHEIQHRKDQEKLTRFKNKQWKKETYVKIVIYSMQKNKHTIHSSNNLVNRHSFDQSFMWPSIKPQSLLFALCHLLACSHYILP
mmetsp:Transcript_46848/g.74948  ORF Transcript_46848/g.74948 Transcript_46848/m.74948 type:complete len:113 (-) Transcript_46848:880-1218(-)